jgi:DNA-directed RNA polymerase subunit omega
VDIKGYKSLIMKKNYRDNNSNDILYKTEELLDAASNRYKMTIQIANRAKRRRYQDIDLVEDLRIKPISKAILEMADEISQLDIVGD